VLVPGFADAMNLAAAITLLTILLLGPLLIRRIEHNLETFVLGIGIVATLLSADRGINVVRRALNEPILITIAVIAAALIFREARAYLDASFGWLRVRLRRSILIAGSIFIVAMLSSVITAIVAALVLVEIVGLAHLHDGARERVVVVGCFAIGLGAVLTPVGEPLSTLAASALNLGFFGLFDLLAPWVVPGVIAMSLLAGYFARGEYFEAPAGEHVRKTLLDILWQGGEVFGFVAGLVLISEAYAPLAQQYVPMLSDAALLWANTVSAVLDNATLVALEVRAVPVDRAREIILALLISGGMLIPGNIPNVIAAGAVRIRSGTWARIAIPIGLVMLGIYFAALRIASFTG